MAHSTEIAKVVNRSDGPHFVARYRRLLLWATATEGHPELSDGGAVYKWESADQPLASRREHETACTDHGMVQLPADLLATAIAAYRSTGVVQRVLVTITPSREVWLASSAPD